MNIRAYQLLSIEDVEKLLDKLWIPNEGIYPPEFIDAPEKLAERKHKDREKMRCKSCGLITRCTCWAGVR